MPFCAYCGTELAEGSVVCPSPECRSRKRPPAAASAPLDLDEVRWLLSRCGQRPWRVGERHWEVLDSTGAVVLRVEATNARQLARFLAAAPRIIEVLLESPPAP